jgi:hypothetical protein
VAFQQLRLRGIGFLELGDVLEHFLLVAAGRGFSVDGFRRP